MESSYFLQIERIYARIYAVSYIRNRENFTVRTRWVVGNTELVIPLIP